MNLKMFFGRIEKTKSPFVITDLQNIDSITSFIGITKVAKQNQVEQAGPYKLKLTPY